MCISLLSLTPFFPSLLTMSHQGIYKENKKVRKQENMLSTKKAIKKKRKKERKNALDQESDQEKKNDNDQEK